MKAEVAVIPLEPVIGQLKQLRSTRRGRGPSETIEEVEMIAIAPEPVFEQKSVPLPAEEVAAP